MKKTVSIGLCLVLVMVSIILPYNFTASAATIPAPVGSTTYFSFSPEEGTYVGNSTEQDSVNLTRGGDGMGVCGWSYRINSSGGNYALGYSLPYEQAWTTGGGFRFNNNDGVYRLEPNTTYTVSFKFRIKSAPKSSLSAPSSAVSTFKLGTGFAWDKNAGGNEGNSLNHMGTSFVEFASVSTDSQTYSVTDDLGTRNYAVGEAWNTLSYTFTTAASFKDDNSLGFYNELKAGIDFEIDDIYVTRYPALDTNAPHEQSYNFNFSQETAFNYPADTGKTLATLNDCSGVSYLPLHKINDQSDSASTAVYESFNYSGVEADTLKVTSPGTTFITLTEDGVPFKFEENKTYRISFEYYAEGNSGDKLLFTAGGIAREWDTGINDVQMIPVYPDKYPLEGSGFNQNDDTLHAFVPKYHTEGYQNGELNGYINIAYPFSTDTFDADSGYISGTATIKTGSFDVDVYSGNAFSHSLKLNPFLQLVVLGSENNGTPTTVYLKKVEIYAFDIAPQVQFYDGDKLISTEKNPAETYNVDRVAPEKTGMAFAGWYLDKALSKPFTTDNGVKSDVMQKPAATGYTFQDSNPVLKLYAKYLPIEYTGSKTYTFGTSGDIKSNANYGAETLVNDKWFTFLPNDGYASKTYNADNLTVSALSGVTQSGTYQTVQDGIKYTTLGNDAPWNEGSPVFITNPDGSAFIPAPNTTYKFTVKYRMPTVGAELENNTFTGFSGLKYEKAVYNDGSVRSEMGSAYSPTGWAQNTVSAVGLTQTDTSTTATFTVKTGDFQNCIPTIGFYVTSSKAAIDQSAPTEIEGRTYYPYISSDIIVESVTVEYNALNDLTVAVVTNAENGVKGSMSNILVSPTGEDYSLTGAYQWYKALFFDWDNGKSAYVIREAIGAGSGAEYSKKGKTVTKNGFVYLIHENKENPNWDAWFKDSFSRIGSNYGASSSLVGTAAYVYGADLIALTADITGTGNAEGFSSNTYISLGKPTPQFAFGGVAILNDAAAAKSENQAVRVYYDYIHDNDSFFYAGEYKKITARGVLFKAAQNTLPLTVENAQNEQGGILMTEKRDNFGACWLKNESLIRYSTFLVKFKITDTREVCFRAYLELEDGTIVYSQTADSAIVTKIKAEIDGVEYEKDGRVLVWNDEFFAEELNTTSKWSFNRTMNTSDRIYANTYENVHIDTLDADGNEGVVHMKLNKVLQEDGSYKFTVSDGLTTIGRMNFTYGRLEARVKLTDVNGTWQSFWMQSSTPYKTANYMSEIDIYENYNFTDSKTGTTNRYFQSVLHKWTFNANGDKDSTTLAQKNWQDSEINKYHVIAFEWTPTTVSVYVDDVLVNSMGITEADEFSTKVPGMQGFHDPHYLIFNNEFFTDANSWQPSPADNLTPDTLNEEGGYEVDYYIDWVRLYQNPETDNIYVTHEIAAKQAENDANAQ